MSERLKHLYHNNELFFLFWIVVSLTFLNISAWLGIAFFVILLVLVYVTLEVKQADDIRYSEYIFKYTDQTEQMLREKIEKERLLAQEREKKRQEEEERRQAEEYVRQVTAEKERKKEELARHEKILTQARELMEEQGLSAEEIEEAIRKKEDELTTEREKTAQEAKHQMNEQKAQPKEEPVTYNEIPSSASANTKPFRVKKHGRILNYLFFGISFLAIFAITSLIDDLGIPLLTGGVAGRLIFMLITTSLVYLPTLLYHASLLGKIVIWGLNFLLTIIVPLSGPFVIIVLPASWVFWLILLLVVIHLNRKHRYQEELLHHVRQKMND